MKKMLAILLAATMLLCCVAFASAEEEAELLLGDWYLHMMSMEGQTYNAGDIGVIMTMTLNADGTCIMDQGDGEPTEGTWAKAEENFTVTFDGDTAEAAYIEDYLIITSSDGMQMAFGREIPTPSYVPAAPVAAEDVAAFEGTWNAVEVSMQGAFLDISMVESEWGTMFGSTDTTIVIKDGAVTIFGDSDTVFALTDGILLWDAGEGLTQSLTLLEDGTLCFDMLGALQVYCEKAE